MQIPLFPAILKSMEKLYLNYNHLNEYLKNKFGERTLKICIDAGFTCPNRDGKCGYGGCIFCGEKGSGEHLTPISIKTQIENYFKSYRSKRANKFIVYFQNFTNTYSNDLLILKKIYDSSLIDSRIVGIQIATRPDCITDKIAKLINSYSNKYYVCVELGLQTSNDNTAKLINRGYPSSTYTKAVSILNKYNIDIVTHIMIGLPNEDKHDTENTINFINKHHIQGIKIHSTYIIKNTKLNKLYENKQYIPISYEYYMENLEYVITHISPELIIHRISGDPPKEQFVAPEWCLHKKKVLNGLDKLLNEKNLYQGIYYNIWHLFLYMI